MGVTDTTGAISVFLCCVMMSIIVFICTVFDLTRFQLLQVQAGREVQLACDSILATYDSQMQSQYGIFGFKLPDNGIEGMIKDYLKLIESKGESVQLMEKDYLKQEIGTDDFLDTEYLTNQIVEFMKIRAPMILLEGLFEDLEILEHAVKSSELIIEKNMVMGEIEGISGRMNRLITLIEGIQINPSSGRLVVNTNKQPMIIPNYVKRIITEEQYQAHPYTVFEIPDNTLRERLNQNAFRYKDWLSMGQTTMGELRAHLTNCLELQRSIADQESQLSSLTESFNRSVDEAIKESLELEIQQLESDIESKNTDYVKEISEFKSTNLLFQQTIQQLHMMTETLDETQGLYGLLGIHHAALLELQLLEEDTVGISGSIDHYEAQLSNQEGLYDEGICENLSQELNQYKVLLGFDENGDPKKLSSLLPMKEKIEANILVLESIQQDTQYISTEEDNLYTSWFQELSASDEERIELSSSLGINTVLREAGDIESRYISCFLSIGEKMRGYSRDFTFDYGEINLSMPEGFDWELLVELAKEIFPSYPIPDFSKIMEDDHLPSVIEGINPNGLSYQPMIDLEQINQAIGFVQNIETGIQEAGNSIAEKLLINEYIMGMFSCAVKNEDEPNISLTGFDQEDHYMQYEVEYVLYGYPEDVVNLGCSVGALMTIRMALNTLSLIADSDKMTRVNTLASAIAGWWSLEIGGILLSILLTVIWATVESVSDVERLLAGQEVPLLKTATTWETDIISPIMSLSEEAAEEVQEEEASLIPSLSYEDYLRIFLLGNLVEDETKIARVMDLIQVNMEVERGQEVDLYKYHSAITLKVDVKVSPVFLGLPFMPDHFQKMKDELSFTVQGSSGY